MLTIFANMRINELERLQHMKDALISFKDVSDDWLINVRGKLREEAMIFLKENLGDKATFFELLDDSRGWIENSLEMLAKAKYGYILLCNEDHVNIASQEYLKQVVAEMADKNSDYLMYSYHPFWQEKLRQFPDQDAIIKGSHIDLLDITESNIKKLFSEPVKRECVVVAAAIYRRAYLEKVMRFEQDKLPMFLTKWLYRIMTGFNMIGIDFNQRLGWDLVNKIVFYKLRKWPKDTPFELEITNDRHYVLPFRLAHPKQELLACIDDDLGVDGYSLIKRGMYPLGQQLSPARGEKNLTDWGYEEILERNNEYTAVRNFISAGRKYSKAYYEDAVRVTLFRTTIVLVDGVIEIASRDKTMIAKPGDVITMYPNIRYVITGSEDSVFISVLSSIHNKKVKFID